MQEVLDVAREVMRNEGERTIVRLKAARMLGSYYGLWDGRGMFEETDTEAV